MKTIKLAEIAARYNTTPVKAEALLERIGWLKDGEVQTCAILKGYLTESREVTILGQGYLFEASRE